MTTDILLTSELETEWNSRGDIATVDGEDRIQQGIIITILETVDLSAPEPTPEAIASQRAAIAESVRDCDVTEPPVDVTVEQSPLQATPSADDALSVTYAVRTNRIAIELTAT